MEGMEWYEMVFSVLGILIGSGILRSMGKTNAELARWRQSTKDHSGKIEKQGYMLVRIEQAVGRLTEEGTRLDHHLERMDERVIDMQREVHDNSTAVQVMKRDMEIFVDKCEKAGVGLASDE
jgi:hypothetical protein